MAARRGERGLLATDLLAYLADVRQSISALVNVATADDMRALGRALGDALRSAGRGALVIGIEGELGAGKTTLVSGVLAGARHRRCDSQSDLHADRAVRGGGLQLYHIDLYRLSGPREVEALGNPRPARCARRAADRVAVARGRRPADRGSEHFDRISGERGAAQIAPGAGPFVGGRQTAGAHPCSELLIKIAISHNLIEIFDPAAVDYRASCSGCQTRAASSWCLGWPRAARFAVQRRTRQHRQRRPAVGRSRCNAARVRSLRAGRAQHPDAAESGSSRHRHHRRAHR